MKIRSGTFASFCITLCAGFCVTNGALCSSSQFTCNNGWNCIISGLVCNYYDDCGDNSDEFGCGYYCSSSQFRCFQSSQCVDSTKACNGIPNDCLDNSDESKCTYTCAYGSVRLVGTGSNMALGEGRVEMCYDNAWGTICGDSGWNFNAAEVVCDQLGFNGPASYSGSAEFGQGTGLILVNGLSCSGQESNLFHCVRSNSYVGDVTGCSHSQDASVWCAPQQPPPHYSDSSSIGIGVGVSVSVSVVIILLCIVLVVWRRRRYTRWALLRNGAVTMEVNTAPARSVTMATHRAVAQTPDYPTDSPPSYSATGYQAAGCQATGYQATGYQASGYQAAGYPINPPPYTS